jgi:hypothetical protein
VTLCPCNAGGCISAASSISKRYSFLPPPCFQVLPCLMDPSFRIIPEFIIIRAACAASARTPGNDSSLCSFCKCFPRCLFSFCKGPEQKRIPCFLGIDFLDALAEHMDFCYHLSEFCFMKCEHWHLCSITDTVPS